MRVLVATNDNILLLDDTGETVCSLPPTPLTSASFNHSGDRLILSNLQVYDVTNPGKPTLRDNSITLPNASSGITFSYIYAIDSEMRVAYVKSPNSTAILVAQDCRVHVYDRAKARITKSIATSSPPTVLIGSKDGQKIAYASTAGIVLYNIQKETSTVLSTAVASHLAFGGKSYLAAIKGTTLLLFDIITSKSSVHELSHSAPITSLAFLDSKVVTSSLDGSVKIFTVGGGIATVDVGAAVTCMDVHGTSISVGTMLGSWVLTLIPGDVYTLDGSVKKHVLNIGGAVTCLAVQPPLGVKAVKKPAGKKVALARKTPGVVNDGALMDFFSPVVTGRRARNVRVGGREKTGGENVEPSGLRKEVEKPVKRVEDSEVVKEKAETPVDIVETDETKSIKIDELVEPTHHSAEPAKHPQTANAAAPSFQYKIIESAISAHISTFRTDMMTEIQDMHVEMMRQFCVQREDMEGMLREYGVEPLVTELRELREENERLRRSY